MLKKCSLLIVIKLFFLTTLTTGQKIETISQAEWNKQQNLFYKTFGDSYYENQLKKIKNKKIRAELTKFYEIYFRMDIDSLKRNFILIPITTAKEHHITFKSEDYTIHIITDTLDVIKHSFTIVGKYSKEKGIWPVVKIDGRKPWGIDGDLPRTSIKNIQIFHKKQQINLPKSAINDLFNPKQQYIAALSKDKHRLYIFMVGSTYEVIWIFVDNKYWSRIITTCC